MTSVGSSNVDALASKIEETDQELKAIRFHSMDTETRAIDLKGKIHPKALAKANEGQWGEQTTEFPPDEEATAPQSNEQGEQLPNFSLFEEDTAAQSTEQSTETQENRDLIRLRQIFARMILINIFLAREAGSKRPNFVKLSLMAGCLAYAGLERDKETPQENGDPHQYFRELFSRGDESDENFNKQLKQWLESLQQNLYYLL